MVKSKRSSLDLMFGALSDPTRRKMLEKLALGDSRVTELARPHDMTLPAISKHLKVLDRAGLIRRYQDGRNQYIQLRTPSLKKAEKWLDFYKRSRALQMESLEDLLSRGGSGSTQGLGRGRKKG
jgi:DNA-binding transcriptional ArsR family regulator